MTVLVLATAACGAARRAAAPRSADDPWRVLWTYEVHGDVDALDVEAGFAPAATLALRVDPDATRFVRDVAYVTGSTWTGAPARDGAWMIPCSAGCRVRYRFALRAAAAAIDDVDTAIASGDVVVAPPSTWLLRPGETAGRLRMRVVLAPPACFAAGMRPAKGDGDTFESSTMDIDEASFAVVGPFVRRTVEVGAAHVQVAVVGHELLLADDAVVAWVRSAVTSIAAYLGRFPVDRTLVIVQAGRPGSPTRGETLGAGGPAVLIRAAAGMTDAAVRDDWVVTHELLHVVLPSLAREHEWLGEGFPTYVEPIVRLRAGLVSAEKFWGDLVEGLPQGQPADGDQGLERTHTWGRTYWGGALFCLMADVTIRTRTNGQRSFDDVVRAIVATGADVETRWTIDDVVAVGDRATGTTTLKDLLELLGTLPTRIDLADLWGRLGVRMSSSGSVAFDDTAPLAWVRRGIEGR